MTRSPPAAWRSASACPSPTDLVPADASVEMEAKKAAGYFTPEGAPSKKKLRTTVGRDLGKF